MEILKTIVLAIGILAGMAYLVGSVTITLLAFDGFWSPWWLIFSMPGNLVMCIGLLASTYGLACCFRQELRNG